MGLWTGSSNSELRLQGQFCSCRPAQCKSTALPMSPRLPRTLSMVLSYIPAKTTVLPPSELPMLCQGAARMSYKPSFWQNQPSRALLCPLSKSFKLANVIDLALQSWKQQVHKMVLWAGCFDGKFDDLGSILRLTWWRGKAMTISLLISTDKQRHAAHQN